MASARDNRFFLVCTVAGCNLLTPPPSVKYLSSLAPGAIRNAKPANVRLAINLPKGVQLVDLRAKVTDVSGATNPGRIRGALSFQVVSASNALAPAPTAALAGGVWSYYKLDAEGQKEFRKIQSYADKHPPGKERTTIMVDLSYKLKLANCDLEGAVPLVAAIMLSPKRGYVVALSRKETVSELAAPENTICTADAD